jgi:hypothetical protein
MEPIAIEVSCTNTATPAQIVRTAIALNCSIVFSGFRGEQFSFLFNAPNLTIACLFIEAVQDFQQVEAFVSTHS